MLKILSICVLFLSGLYAQSRQVIKDPKGQIIGTIICDKQRCEARDPKWNLRGIYEIKSNRTKDPAGRLVAYGNVLVRLL